MTSRSPAATSSAADLTVAPRLWEGATTLVNRTTLAEF